MGVTNMLGRACRKLMHESVAIVGRAALRKVGVNFGASLRLHGLPIVTVSEGATITLGDRVVLCSWSAYTALGVAHPVILRALMPGAIVSVGDDVGMSGTVVCAAQSIEIGAGVLLGANVIVADTDFHPMNPVGRRYASLEAATSMPVVIGANVFIGANSIVLKGSQIGDGSVIGAGSVVTGRIPANVVAAGNPCRVLRELQAPLAKSKHL